MPGRDRDFVDRIIAMERRLAALEALGISGLAGTDQTIKASHDRLDTLLGAGKSTPDGTLIGSFNADQVDGYHASELADGKWLAPDAFANGVGATKGLIQGAGSWDAYDTWVLEDAGTNSVRGNFMMPLGWGGLYLNFRWIFAADTAVANNFRITRFIRYDATGALLTGNGTGVTTDQATPGVAKTRFDLTYKSVATVEALTLVRNQVVREGAHANDSATGSLHFLGCFLWPTLT